LLGQGSVGIVSVVKAGFHFNYAWVMARV